MINLLPLNEKIKIRSEYRLRLYTITGIMFLVLIIFVAIPLVISYFVISYNVQFINDITDNLLNSEGFKKTDIIASVIKDTNRKSTLLNDPLGISVRQNIIGSLSSVFEIADKLNNTKNETIKITQIVYDQTAKKVATPVSGNTGTTTVSVIKESGIHRINIKGFASNRDVFLAFLKSVETEKNFLSIDSPVSNLVNDSNIDFTLAIILRDKAI